MLGLLVSERTSCNDLLSRLKLLVHLPVQKHVGMRSFRQISGPGENSLGRNERVVHHKEAIRMYACPVCHYPMA